MANFTKRPSTKNQSHGGFMAYSKGARDRYSNVMCEGKTCKRVNTLTEAELGFCESKGIKNLCYDCQRSEGVVE